MPRAFCSQCGAEVPVDESGRCYVGHDVDIGTGDTTLQSIADQAALQADDARAEPPDLGSGDEATPSRFDLDDADDAGDEPEATSFDIAELEAAVAELGFSREDLASVPADEDEELVTGTRKQRPVEDTDADADDETAHAADIADPADAADTPSATDVPTGEADEVSPDSDETADDDTPTEVDLSNFTAKGGPGKGKRTRRFPFGRR